MKKDSKIAVLGYGLEGVAMLKWLQNHDFSDITVCDHSESVENNLPSGVKGKLGKDYLEGLEEFDVVFRSPGIKFLEPGIQKAVGAGVKVTGVIPFFMENCPCPVVGVTGTKGKGTTSTLIYEILRHSGKSVYLGGNIGVPAIEFLDELKSNDLVVLELSSFQLQDLKISPQFSVLLNTTEDHLDYHQDRKEYLEAKESIVKYQSVGDVVVFNADYPYREHYQRYVRGNVRFVSRMRAVDFGAFVRGEEVWYANDGKEEKILDISDIGLVGSHNLENVMPAVVIAKELGIPNKIIVEAVRDFKGLPHRLEFVEEIDGIRFFNDSFATTPETSMAAIDAFDEEKVLIAGGFDKGLDYRDWAMKAISDVNLKAVILVGDTAEKMRRNLEEAKEKVKDLGLSENLVVTELNLKDALTKAKSLLSKGVIVMSPGSSSFDLYSSYKERGEIFRKLVREMK